jgi:hypothetical protein
MATYPIRLVAEDELAGFLAVDRHAGHGQRGPGHRSDARFPRGALHRDVVGTGTLVPHDLLGFPDRRWGVRVLLGAPWPPGPAGQVPFRRKPRLNRINAARYCPGGGL